MLVRAGQYGLNSNLLALLAGYGGVSGGSAGGAGADDKEKVLDASEEEMIKSKNKNAGDDSAWD
jgi:hypothetical protein